MILNLNWLFPFLVLTSTATAQPQPKGIDHARKARVAVAAFQCSILAGDAGNGEGEKLFNFAYSSAKDFLKAAETKQISEQAWHSTVPMVFGMVMQGPNHDFMIGRLWAQIERDTFRQTYCEILTDKCQHDRAVKKSMAETEQLSWNSSSPGTGIINEKFQFILA